jgi:SNF2 family DNA or RNA helicase
MKPYAHQLISLKHNEKTDIVFDCSDAGTGKTGVRIFRYVKRKAKKAGCMLVLGLRSTLRSVWESDFAKFAPSIVTSVANAANREAAFKAKVDVYITNHDAVKWLAAQKPAFFARFDEIVIDESEFFKHHTSQRSKALRKIIKHFKYRTCMTATPNDNTIIDVWHQVLLLDEGQRLGKLYSQFRQAVAQPVQVGPRTNMIEWRDKDGAEEAVFGLLADIVVRHRLDDCADIPENHQYPLMYDMSSAQKKAYLQMENSKMLDLGKLGGITAINAAAVATKLLQVASGAVYSAPDTYSVIDTSRYELILDLCEQRKHPLVLFLWRHQRDLLVAEAEKRGLIYAVFDGETSDDERLAIVQRYQRGQYDVLFAHPKTVGHGQTLTRGTSTIWASPTHLAAQFIQASSRQRRIGQTEKTETLVVIATGTKDEWVYENCMRKDGRMKNLLEMFADNTVAA